MKLTETALRFNTTVYVLIFCIVILGGMSYASLPLEAAPEIKIPIILVHTLYPGVAPQDMERLVTLQTVDQRWREHLLAMDHLKEGIGLRGYAQQNPRSEDKREGLERCQEMIEQIKNFSDKDMQMVINYTSRIPVPAEDLAPSADWLNPDFD